MGGHRHALPGLKAIAAYPLPHNVPHRYGTHIRVTKGQVVVLAANDYEAICRERDFED
jgi:hypothetical protein